MLRIATSTNAFTGTGNPRSSFGSLMPGRTYSSNTYKFGFNGKENDDEVFGSTGTFQDYGMRMYDNRICRFISVDPITNKFPHLSPYQFASNSPIANIDFDGLESLNPQTGAVDWGDCPTCNEASKITHVSMSPPLIDFNSEGSTTDYRVKHDRVTQLEQGSFTQNIKGIVLHQTDSKTAQSALNSFKSGRNGTHYGTHFLIDKDGTIYMTANLKQYTLHVGATRKNTYPNNYNSIGIEIVGKYDPTTKTWEGLTEQQVKSLALVVNSLLKEYDLKSKDIYTHGKIGYKTPDEGAAGLEAIQGKIVEPGKAGNTPTKGDLESPDM